MDLEQLKYFQSVANTENISKSARELYISQPTLSKALSRLENEVGYSLFYREKGQIRLNGDGRIFLDYVQRAFGELNMGIEKLNLAHNREKGLIAVAGLCDNTLSGIIREYLTINKGVDINIRLKFGTGQWVVDQLINYEIDFALLNYVPEDRRLVCDPVRTEKLYLAVSMEHPLAFRESVSLTELKEERFICNDNCVGKNKTIEYCAQAGFKPNIVADSNDNRISEEFVVDNMGVYLLPERQVEHWKRRFSDWGSTVKFLETEERLSYHTYLCSRKQMSMYPLTQDFYKFARERILAKEETIDILPDYR